MQGFKFVVMNPSGEKIFGLKAGDYDHLTEINIPFRAVYIKHALIVGEDGKLWKLQHKPERGEPELKRLTDFSDFTVAVGMFSHEDFGYFPYIAGIDSQQRAVIMVRGWCVPDMSDPPGTKFRMFEPPGGIIHVKAVAAGSGHFVFIDTKGNVWTGGNNGHGQLGLGDFEKRPTDMYPVPGLADIVEISCGSDHTLALRSDGIMFAFGNGDRGQLGLGCTPDERHVGYPREIEAVPRMRNIWCGSVSSYAQDLQGQTYVFGSNCALQLALDDTISGQVTPCLNPRLPLNVSIITGDGYIVTIDQQGLVTFYGSLYRYCDSWTKQGGKVLDIDLRSCTRVKSAVK